MGEWSKKIGEFGEEIIGNFLHIIGWGDFQKGLEFKCSKPTKHGTNGKNNKTHGIDFLFSYQSPLIDGTLDNLIISSKYTADKYPSNPNSKFKSHFTDLAQTIECFKKSHIRQEINQEFSGVSHANDIGVLFWLSNNRESKPDIITDISKSRINNRLLYENIYVVDNNRMAFVYDTISFLKNQYSDAELNFFYPDTGKNLNPLSLKNSGKVLPVQFINTSVLPLRIDNEKGSMLIFSVIDNFNKSSLKRLMGLAQKITSSFQAQTLILFPDFDELEHKNEVQRTKVIFEDKKFTETVEIVTYKKDFRSLKK